jgi:hypothetical protein
MNRTLALVTPLLAAAILAASPGLVAQQSATSPVSAAVEQPLPSTTPLAITISPAPYAKGETPLFATVTLTNTTDHDVQMPEPNIGCTDVLDGSVILEVQFTPAAGSTASNAPPQTVCAVKSQLAEGTLISENPAAHWLTLAPGDTANFAQRIITSGSENSAGTFTLRGNYTPPQIPPAAAERLYSLSISYPTEPLTSAPVTVSTRHDAGTASVAAGLFR